MIGKAKFRGWKEPSASWNPGRAGSTTRCTACAGAASSPSRSAASKSGGWSQRPSRAMPTGMTSYLSRSSIAATKRAEAREISCSAERPPKIRASCSMAASLSAAREGRKFGDASRGAHRGAHQTVEKGVQVLQLVEGVDEDVTDRATQAVQADHRVEHREAQRQPVLRVGRRALLDSPEQARPLVPLGLREGDEIIDQGAQQALAELAGHELAVIGVHRVRELVASQLGERLLRTLIDDLIAFSDAQQYERPGLLRTVEERTTADAQHRLSLGFAVLDAVVGLHSLRGAISDVLVDALVLDEMPAFADTLDQLKDLNVFLDRLVCATMSAA